MFLQTWLFIKIHLKELCVPISWHDMWSFKSWYPGFDNCPAMAVFFKFWWKIISDTHFSKRWLQYNVSPIILGPICVIWFLSSSCRSPFSDPFTWLDGGCCCTVLPLSYFGLLHPRCTSHIAQCTSRNKCFFSHSSSSGPSTKWESICSTILESSGQIKET